LSAIVAPGFNPKFSLINHDGKPVTEKDYNDKHQLIYFGFTFCPEICPTELQKIAGTLELLGDIASKIHPIFVSVDPTRDTPEVMKQYLSNFGKDFIGLTGTEETVDNAMTSFKVYAQKENDPAYADYMMAHSSYIYFLAPNGDLLGLYKKDDTSETIADGIKTRFK
jgi:protein SCO1/2